MNAKGMAAALFLSIAAAVAGIAAKSYWLIAVGAAAALLSLCVYFHYANVKKKKLNEEKKLLEIQKIQQVNFPEFMYKVKQKYGEIIFKYRLPPKPLMLEGFQYWCCNDYLIILPEWNYYQELIYKKYKDCYIYESDENKLLDDMFVVNKRDIFYFEKSREHSYAAPHKTPAYTSKKTCLSYRKNGLTAEKILPEAAYDILMQLIPDKAKTIGAVFPGK